MANYPIKMLKDEQNNPFVPLTSTKAVRNENGQTVEQMIANKLSPDNIKQGENIVISVDGADVTITADVPDTTVLVDNLTTTSAGVGALDARQGNVLLSTIQAKSVPTGGNAGQVLKKRTSDDNDLEWGDAADPNAISGDGSIKRIIEMTYEEYQALEEIDPDTEYHIIESGSTSSIEYEIRRIVQEMDRAKHPIGSLEFNTSGINPSSYLGFGTWELWGAGKVPIGVDSTDESIDEADKVIGNKMTSYTPEGINTGGSVGNHTLTVGEMPTHSHSFGNWIDWYAKGNAQGIIGAGTGAGVTTDAGGGGAHNHGFTQPTFNGTQADINVVQPSISCYMWKRVA